MAEVLEPFEGDSPFAMLAFTSFYTVICLPLPISHLKGNNGAIVITVVMLSLLAICWALTTVRCTFKKYDQVLIQAIQNFVLLGIVFISGARMLFRISSGACSSYGFEDIWWCNPNYHSNSLPTEAFVVAILLPIIYGVTLRKTSVWVLLTSWTLVICYLIAAIIISKAHSAAYVLVMYAPISAFLIYEHKKRFQEQHATNHRLRSLLEENEKMREENRESDLKFMVGNLAHDLKTVSACLMR